MFRVGQPSSLTDWQVARFMSWPRWTAISTCARMFATFQIRPRTMRLSVQGLAATPSRSVHDNATFFRRPRRCDFVRLLTRADGRNDVVSPFLIRNRAGCASPWGYGRENYPLGDRKGGKVAETWAVAPLVASSSVLPPRPWRPDSLFGVERAVSTRTDGHVCC